MRLNTNDIISTKEQKAIKNQLAAGELSKGKAIRALFAGGLSVKEISDFTGILYNHCYNVVSQEVMKSGLEADVIRGRAGGSKKAQILELLESGKSIKEVSIELGTLYNQVWQIAKAAGLTPKQKAAAAATATTEG